MGTAALILCLLYGAGLAFLAREIAEAPLGVEDERGFVAGEDAGSDITEFSEPGPAPAGSPRGLVPLTHAASRANLFDQAHGEPNATEVETR
jgi:hypothetical protein